MLLLTVTLLGVTGILLYHPFFSIQTVNISGLQRVARAELTDTVHGVLDYRRFFVLPGSSYFMVDTDEVADVLMRKFPLVQVGIQKKFPQTLNISVEEKISTIIYDNGNAYHYLGEHGTVVETLSLVPEHEWQEAYDTATTTLADGTVRVEKKLRSRTHTPNVLGIIEQYGDYPIIYDKRDVLPEISASALTEDDALAIIEWFRFLEKRAHVPFGYMSVTDTAGEGFIHTGHNWELRVRLTDLQSQFDELLFILNEKVDQRNLSYIDLRYPGRVYWQ